MAARSPLALAELQLHAGYVHGADGRLLAVNDIGRPRPPMAVLSRTSEGTLVRFGASAPAALVADVEAFAAALPPFSGAEAGGDGVLERFLEVARRHVSVTEAWAGPAFAFPEPLFPSLGAMQIYPANAHLLHPDLVSWAPELRERRPCFAVLRGGQGVAICCSSRTNDAACEAGVEVAAASRGQGAAGLAVAAWAAAVRASGREPIYSTSWANGASRAVARKLELELFAENLRAG